VRPSARRWLVVAALFVVTYGISTPLAAYGVFLPVLAEQFAWSRGAIATALSINLLVGGVAGFVIGALADRHGPRVMLMATVALAGAAFALVSTIEALWQLYLFVGVLGGIGMSSFYLLSATTVTHWFEARRGLALALVLVGFSLGYIWAGPLAAALITLHGWRTAYALLGGGCGLLTLLAALTVRLPHAVEAVHLGRPHAAGPPGARAVVAGVTLRAALADPRQCSSTSRGFCSAAWPSRSRSTWCRSPGTRGSAWPLPRWRSAPTVSGRWAGGWRRGSSPTSWARTPRCASATSCRSSPWPRSCGCRRASCSWRRWCCSGSASRRPTR
jgi:MFS family permease